VSAPDRVVVAIVVDQLSAWAADDRLPRLPPSGFFARMRREGTWVHALRFPYAETDTGPGHASLYTGAVPADSGIVANEIPGPVRGDSERVGILHDARTKLVTPVGVEYEASSSAASLLVPTVADRLRAARPNAAILSVSLKDRAALLPAGQKPTHAFWFEPRLGSFVTTTAVETSFPPWAARVAGPEAVAEARSRTWEPTDARWLARFAGRDDAPGEGDLDGLGTTFPHVARTNAAFRATPASDEMILDLALAGAVAEARPREPLFVLLSMSASDVIGHTFGPGSWEAWDQLRKLDAALERFVERLETRFGAVRVALASDHGDIPLPEARDPTRPDCRPPTEMRPWCFPGGRIDPNALTEALRDVAGRGRGSGIHPIAGMADGYLYLTERARNLPEAERAALDDVVRRVVLGMPEHPVAALYDARELAVRCPAVRARALGSPARARAGATEDLLTLVCRSWRPDRGGDYYVVPARGWIFDVGPVRGKGSGHGTPYLYDRTVPFLFRGGVGEGPAGLDVRDPVDFVAFSAVLGSFLGLDARLPDAALSAAVASGPGS
jgi:hypothetical protein